MLRIAFFCFGALWLVGGFLTRDHNVGNQLNYVRQLQSPDLFLINLNGFFVNICGSITVILGIALFIRWIVKRGRADAISTAGSIEPVVDAPQPSPHKAEALSVLYALANPPITEPLEPAADVDFTLCMHMVLDAGGTPHDTALAFLIERIQGYGPTDALVEAQRLTGLVIALQSSKSKLSQMHLIALKHLEDDILSPKAIRLVDEGDDEEEELEKHNTEERAMIEGAFDCVAVVVGTTDDSLFHRFIQCLNKCEGAIGDTITAKALLVREFIKGATEGRGVVVNGRHFQITGRMSPGLEDAYRLGVTVRLLRPELVDRALRSACEACNEAHRSYMNRAF